MPLFGDLLENQELLPALNEINVGIVLLDKHLMARFINDAFLKLWDLPENFFSGFPDFAEIMRAVASKRKTLTPLELDAYIALRIKLVQAGEEDPRDIRMPSGATVRVSCKALPNGGRMILYTDISDLVRNAEKLQEMAMTDSLTGLHNRRFFFDAAASEWNRYRRYRNPLSVVTIDIDDFKLVNDQYGHDVGDRVITSVAEVCRASKRQSDIAARIGGEEFALLLPQTDIENAHAVAERLRTNIEKNRVITKKTEVKVTSSLGVSATDSSVRTIDDLLRMSDQAL